MHHSIPPLSEAREQERIKQREIFVQKKWEHDGVSHTLTKVIQEELGIKWITAEVYDKYYVQGGDADNGLTDDEFELARKTIFAELPLETTLEINEFYGKVGSSEIIDIADVPGQFSQRTDSVEKSLLAQCERDFGGKVKSNHVIVLRWNVTPEARKKIHDWVINPVEKVEQKKDDILFPDPEKSPGSYRILDTFNTLSEAEYTEFAKKEGISLEVDDFLEVQKYFRNVEKRNPTYTELKLIETYWSDHCRHTTFHTAIENIKITGNTPEIIADIKASQKSFEKTLAGKKKTLMNLAMAGFKKIKGENKLWENRTEYDSLENNACSYETEVENEKWGKETWVIMFKNETHNSPTETEPFGGAATCIGGCIRDPLSGGTYTFQAMRISGSGNPTERLSETMAGKLSQKFISLVSALGYSSYGNQIGLATGMVREFFHPGFKAKHLELGYVVAAAPKWHNKRSKPKKGDIVLMIGGRTGRDGKWGATISSKGQDASQDKHQMWAHVQKGNAPEERKLQRLFLNPEFVGNIIKCNDFGAGGVSVAVGELAEWLDINLDKVLTKYSWLSDEDLAHSESQERMAVVISPENYESIMAQIEEENLEAIQVAEITDDEEHTENNYLKMNWKWNKVVNISRDFLNTMWAKKIQKTAHVTASKSVFFTQEPVEIRSLTELNEKFLKVLSLLWVASQQWLGSIFDSSVGASTILAPYGGKYQKSPQIGMTAKIPSLNKDDGLDFKTAIISAFGGHPHLSDSSPYLAGMYAVIDAISRTVAMGGDIEKVWLTAQEYFWKLGKDDARWGEIYGIMLGFFRAQIELNVPAIGGKDSASGTFKKGDETLHVPTTLFTVANSPQDSSKITSAEFQEWDNDVLYFPFPRDENGLPIWEEYRKVLTQVSQLHNTEMVASSSVVEQGGVAASVAKMCFGNKMGFEFAPGGLSFNHDMGGIIIELKKTDVTYKGVGKKIGKTLSAPVIVNATTDGQNDGLHISLEEAQQAWEKPLEKVYSQAPSGGLVQEIDGHTKRWDTERTPILFGPDGRIISGWAPEQVNFLTNKPKVVIPVFPGTNSELDTKHALHKSGFTDVEIFVFKTKTPEELTESFTHFAKLVWEAQMIVLPGGFSGADEPGGSAKFANTIFRSTKVRDAMNTFFQKPNTLALGICNGFQMLIKLGVFEKWEISDFQTESDMTLAHNTHGRHVTDLVGLKVTSVLSPFFNTIDIWDTFIVPISHGEWRIVFRDKMQFSDLLSGWQIVLQYLDEDGNPTNRYNGSENGVAGICSPDGRILGLMPHPERSGLNVFKNVPGNKHLGVFDGAADALGVTPK